MAKRTKKWLQGAVNPAHKGYCTPMTKSTCTPRRKAFAMRAKHGGFKSGGVIRYGIGDKKNYMGDARGFSSGSGDQNIADIGKPKPHGSYKSYGIHGR